MFLSFEILITGKAESLIIHDIDELTCDTIEAVGNNLSKTRVMTCHVHKTSPAPRWNNDSKTAVTERTTSLYLFRQEPA